MGDPLPFLCLLQRPTESSHRLLIAKNLDCLHKALELIHAQQHRRGNTVARDRNDLLPVLHASDQIQQFVFGLAHRDEFVDLWHIDLQWATLMAIIMAGLNIDKRTRASMSEDRPTETGSVAVDDPATA